VASNPLFSLFDGETSQRAVQQDETHIYLKLINFIKMCFIFLWPCKR